MKRRTRKILIIVIAVCVLLVCALLVKRPERNTRVYETDTNTIETSKKTDTLKTTEEISEEDVKEAIVPEEKEESEIVDAHVYTEDELTDELIKEKLVGYWEFDDFGYLGGYRFYENGFLQLILERKVNQTGIFMVRQKGVYFSLDGKTWSEDAFTIKSVSDSEIIGAFGENVLTIKRADENLIEKNSGYSAETGKSGAGGMVDVSSEAQNGVGMS